MQEERSGKGVVLRGYARRDLDAMFRLDQACFEEPFRFTKRTMRRFAEARQAQVLVAAAEKPGGTLDDLLEQHELAGFSIVQVQRSRGETVGYLLTLDVAPAFRRRGLAQQLMEQAERDAQGAGCAAMLLHVFHGNPGAVALYEKLGYRQLGTAEHFYGRGFPAWAYRKELR